MADQPERDPHNLPSLERLAVAAEQIAEQLRRIANHFDPPPSDVVDSTYVSQRLGCTTTWVAQMARAGIIPKSCIVPGSGNGRYWKFVRSRIEKWIASR